jgi:hypothetical protein
MLQIAFKGNMSVSGEFFHERQQQPGFIPHYPFWV